MDPGPDLELHPHHHSGRQWVDVLLGVSVVVISVISLVLAHENGEAMKRLVDANSWPFVMTAISNGDEAGNRFLRLLMQNKGVGPAKIESVEVFYRGQAMPDAKTLIHKILGPSADGRHVPMVLSNVDGNVLSAKETINFVTVNDKSISPDDMKLLTDASGEIQFKTCYCSVFDECWTIDSRQQSFAPKPTKVCAHPSSASY